MQKTRDDDGRDRTRGRRGGVLVLLFYGYLLYFSYLHFFLSRLLPLVQGGGRVEGINLLRGWTERTAEGTRK